MLAVYVFIYTNIYTFLNVDISFIYNLLFSLNSSNQNTFILLLLFNLFFIKNKVLLTPPILYIFLLTNTTFTFSFCRFWPVSLNYGFNLIHPLLFYLSFVGIVVTINNKNYCIIKVKTLVFIAVTALLLGMYWGSINQGWGFFWTNDLIELCLLMLLLVIVYYLHSLKVKSTLYLYGYLVYLVIVYMVCLRYNIVFTVHSFFINRKLLNSGVLIFIYFYIFSIKNNLIYLFLISQCFLYLLFTYIANNLIKINIKNVTILLIHIQVVFITVCLTFLLYYYNVYDLITKYFFTVVQNYYCVLSSQYKILTFNHVKLSLIDIQLNWLYTFSLYINVYYLYNYIFYAGALYLYLIVVISVFKIYNN